MGVCFFKGKIFYFTKKMMIPFTFYPMESVLKVNFRCHDIPYKISSILKSTFFHHFVGNESCYIRVTCTYILFFCQIKNLS